ncbi:DNA-binding response regulator [Virgisporangium aliadipatigenens]|uniref:DNA-binding response regulator n=1 Tax=Virgisporangium aliadipatigenens TaxID=741659 RepID=A0A8J4DME3_9ACTN|nr:response regulator transcription factor [Virgisporangium aliadipatigenens]GIJ43690.1 DNA-binding response regulator [Virgisporangium aliadipatigenens]
MRILVCDDQPLIRTAYATIFGVQPGIEVAGTADDGEQAVRLARALRPDVVLMDIRMPVLDGIEATRRLAGPEVADPLTVLVVTTFNLDEYVYRALRAGASGFLLKDAQPAELVAAVRTVAAGDALVSPTVTRRLIGHFGERIRPAEPPDGRAALLAPRESEVLALIARGMTNAEIAAELTLSPETVKTYVSRILTKLDLRDRVHAVVWAFRNGIAPIE